MELRDVTDMLYGVIQAKLCNTCSSPITLQGNNQTFTLERSRSLGNQKSGHKRSTTTLTLSCLSKLLTSLNTIFFFKYIYECQKFLPVQTFDTHKYVFKLKKQTSTH